MMRLRHIPGSEEQIAESIYVVQAPEEKKGRNLIIAPPVFHSLFLFLSHFPLSHNIKFKFLLQAQNMRA